MFTRLVSSFCFQHGDILRRHMCNNRPWTVSLSLRFWMRLQQRLFCSEHGKKSEASVTTKRQSWVHLLYEDDTGTHNNLQKLRRKLDVALISTRSHEKGDLLPYLVVDELVQFYESLPNLEEKALLFKHLADKLGVDFNNFLSNIRQCHELLQDNERMRYRYQLTLMNSLTPSYKHLFDDISKVQFGTSFLVNMRKELRACFREKHLTKSPNLMSFDTCLKEHLARWFDNGFLDLEEVTWGKSPGVLLEKVMNYEAVHVIKDWDDLKSRAGSGRRIFTFSHKLMPGEPLVILHTLIGTEVPNNIQTVLDAPRFNAPVSDVTTATFYSVTSTQRGLDGIGLGNLLIKRVVEKLKGEFINMSTFMTLSPIPGFKNWLDLQLSSLDVSDKVPSFLLDLFPDGIDHLKTIKKHLTKLEWYKDEEVCELLREPLTRLCIHYLVNTKRRGFASNPVAHFHLRNGASIWKINWLGNTNDYGFKSAYGFMVNYVYELAQLEENNNNYVQSGTIVVSNDIQRYMK